MNNSTKAQVEVADLIDSSVSSLEVSGSASKAEAAAVDSPFITLEEAAAYARCSVRTIQRLLKDGRLPRRGVGRPLIDKVELHDLMMAGKSSEVT